MLQCVAACCSVLQCVSGCAIKAVTTTSQRCLMCCLHLHNTAPLPQICSRPPTSNRKACAIKALTTHNVALCTAYTYGMPTIRRLLKITGLFCKRDLKKRQYSAKETYNFKEPTNRNHPIVWVCPVSAVSPIAAHQTTCFVNRTSPN